MGNYRDMGPEARDRRKQQWADRYVNLRRTAIKVLGGGCVCGETDPGYVYILAKTKEAKGWSQNRFYKEIVDCYRDDGSEDKLAARELGVVVCKRCRFYAMGLEAVDRKKAIKEAKVEAANNPPKGDLYWVAGERVEQLPPGATGFFKGEELDMPKVYQHEDINLFGED